MVWCFESCAVVELPVYEMVEAAGFEFFQLLLSFRGVFFAFKYKYRYLHR